MDVEDLTKELEALEKATPTAESSGVPEDGDLVISTTTTAVPSVEPIEREFTMLPAPWHIHASTQTVPDETQRVDTDKMSEILSDADIEMSSPQTTEKALSDAGSATCRLPPPSKMRQVGVAQVTVKLLSLFGGTEEDDADGTDSEYDFDGWDAEECWDDGGGGGSAGNSGAIATTEDSAPAAPVSGGTSTSRGRPPPEDEDEERRRKRPKRQADRLCSGPLQSRFACPYQAYDQARDCLKPSTRNRQGGCESIKRVKQHLARRHMVSSRCTRCWASMETRKKLEEHQRNAICPEVEKPTAECFMAEELESLVTQKPRDGGSDTATPEKSWWNLFKMLIPDMQEAEGATGNDSASFMPIMTAVVPEGISRSLPVPVFAVDASLRGASFAAPPDIAPVETSLDGFVSDIFDTSSPIIRTPTATTSRSSVSAYQAGTGDINAWADNTVAANPTSGAMQLQRDYDMLKLRNEQTLLENSELEEGRKAAREDVKAAQAILHEIMEMPAVQGAPYDRLLEMAGILIKAGGRLR
ncbi:hypothetical protein F5X68DRAFT_279861 [Plectosphaerella plurivora]|uniref:C2H2-type domain-containing protein n=1 Tax=Plectosphaerella plurivora TaxID=936078 RepID=A0A9P8V0X7_9PEZI|nr:hypothetical protein F5X68DRAFT_279861 [Plectosphaerella plurivora]